jgi:hypothetical protein
MFRKLVNLFGYCVEEFAARVCSAATEPELVLLGRGVQYEIVDHLARGHVNHFDTVVIDCRDVNPLVISLLPYLYVGLLLSGFTWSAIWSARSPSFAREIPSDLNALQNEAD